MSSPNSGISVYPLIPDVWLSSWRIGILCPCVSNFTYFVTSSSRLSFPCSTSCMIAAAVNCLVTEPISYVARAGVGTLSS